MPQPTKTKKNNDQNGQTNNTNKQTQLEIDTTQNKQNTDETTYDKHNDPKKQRIWKSQDDNKRKYKTVKEMTLQHEENEIQTPKT